MISPQDWQIYVAKLAHLQITYSSVATLIPTVVGALGLESDQREQLRSNGCVFDDEGDNISSVNPYFCELTSIYWALNNTKSEYIGNAHYRRKWNDEGILYSEPGVLYVSDSHHCGESIAGQFLRGHNGFNAPAITIGLAERKLIPFTADEMRAIWAQPILHGTQMARGPRRCYKAFMDLAFEALWPFWEENKQEIMALDNYNRRMVGFVGERMMTGLILCRDRFFDFPIATSVVEYKP